MDMDFGIEHISIDTVRTVLLFGTKFSLESTLDYTRMMSKYVMDTYARITTTSDVSQEEDDKN
jgi:hypothetical protein